MTNDKTILIGRCDEELDVKYPFHWAQEVIDESEKLGFTNIDLIRENFNEEHFNQLIQEKDPFFVFCSGHGNEYSLRGHRKTPVIIANKNDYLLRDKVAYILSCYTAKYLGCVAFDKGCSYIGYSDRFIFIHQNLQEPLADLAARPFKEASNEVALAILSGGSPKEAYMRSQAVFDKWIDYFGNIIMGKTKTILPLNVVQDIMGALLNDKKVQRCLAVES